MEVGRAWRSGSRWTRGGCPSFWLPFGSGLRDWMIGGRDSARGRRCGDVGVCGDVKIEEGFLTSFGMTWVLGGSDMADVGCVFERIECVWIKGFGRAPGRSPVPTRSRLGTQKSRQAAGATKTRIVGKLLVSGLLTN